MNYRRAYIENSIVFITIVTQNRNPILINKIDTLKHSINEVTQYYDFEIIAYVILNDHLHFLIKTQDIAKYPKIIHSIKYNFTKNVGVATPPTTNFGKIVIGNIQFGMKTIYTSI